MALLYMLTMRGIKYRGSFSNSWVYFKNRLKKSLTKKHSTIS